jgi:hypothetical protein
MIDLIVTEHDAYEHGDGNVRGTAATFASSLEVNALAALADGNRSTRFISRRGRTESVFRGGVDPPYTSPMEYLRLHRSGR